MEKNKIPKTYKVDNYTKKLFASMETSGDISGDWLQLEPSTFKDLQKRKWIRPEAEWKDLKDPIKYDEIAGDYINYLLNGLGMKTIEQAALWSFRPGYYREYGGNIENIPLDKKGSFGKSARQVMKQRNETLTKFLREYHK